MGTVTGIFSGTLSKVEERQVGGMAVVILISCNELQFAKARPPMLWTELPNESDVALVQPLNASLPILRIVAESSMDDNDVQLEKAWLGITVKEEGKLTWVREEQSRKHPSPSDDSDAFRLNACKLMQLSNA